MKLLKKFLVYINEDIIAFVVTVGCVLLVMGVFADLFF